MRTLVSKGGGKVLNFCEKYHSCFVVNIKKPSNLKHRVHKRVCPFLANFIPLKDPKTLVSYA